MEVVVRAPLNDTEREISRLMMDEDVGRSLVLGDFGMNADARAKLQELSTRFGNTSSGAAASLVLANSLARPLRNIRTGKVARKAEPERSRQALSVATRSRSATELVDLAVAVVAPTDVDAPILKQVAGEPSKRTKAKGRKTRPRGDDAAAKRLTHLKRALAR